jgi:hypothetical protein
MRGVGAGDLVCGSVGTDEEVEGVVRIGYYGGVGVEF